MYAQPWEKGVKVALPRKVVREWIKDTKEIRIKAEFENIGNIKRVAIPLTDEVIDAMTITASPLFEGDLHAELEREIARQVKTEESIFTHRLNIKTICQGCEYKLA